MSKIQINGFYCLNKVAMPKAIQTNTSFNLKESKAFTDALLKDGIVEIDLSESTKVMELFNDLKKANANVGLIE